MVRELRGGVSVAPIISSCVRETVIRSSSISFESTNTAATSTLSFSAFKFSQAGLDLPVLYLLCLFHRYFNSKTALEIQFAPPSAGISLGHLPFTGLHTNKDIIMASVTSLDQDMKRLRMSRYTPQAAKEVRGWIEDTLGEQLPSGDLLETLKDGTILCR
jgi:hypothetical protein